MYFNKLSLIYIMNTEHYNKQMIEINGQTHQIIFKAGPVHKPIFY